MSEPLHPAAPHHLPSFITAPGDTDVLMVVVSIDRATGELVAGPDVVSRGFVYMRQSDDLIDATKNVVRDTRSPFSRMLFVGPRTPDQLKTVAQVRREAGQ